MQPIPKPRFDPIGMRFYEIERRLSELEDTLGVMRDLVTQNNNSLQEILKAIAGEKPQ